MTVGVLFLSCHLPYPPLSGGRRREFELIKRLSDDYAIHLVVASKTYAEDLGNARALEPYCEAIDIFETHASDDPGLAPQVRRHACPDIAPFVADVLASGSVDLLHVEGFYLMQHVPLRPGVPLLLVEQNVEGSLYDQRVTRAPTRAERKAMARDRELTWRAEHDAWWRADVIGAVTQEDRAIIRTTITDRPLVFVPDGVDHLHDDSVAGETDGNPLPESPSAVFVANFAYQPNVDAAAYFCGDILPRVRRRVPDTVAWLVGNDPSPDVQSLACDNTVITGRVDSVLPYLRAADVIVCPLRIGGGIKVKLLEAASCGKAIVTTSIGAQGFPACGCRAFAIEDDPKRFARRVARLLQRPHERDVLGRAAADLARSLPTWDDAARAVAGCYEDMMPIHGERPSRSLAVGLDPLNGSGGA